jgi:hypothetical protein
MSGTVRLSAFLPYIMPYVDGCPRPVAEKLLRSAIIEFCEKTRAWRYIVNVELTVQDQSVTPPPYTTIHEIEQATWNGQPLDPTQFTQAAPDQMTGRVSQGAPKWITQIGPDMLSVYPFMAGAVALSVFLKPKTDQRFGLDPTDPLHDAYNVCPAFMFHQHAEPLAAGALARLFALPNQRFTDVEQAGFYMQKFALFLAEKSSTNLRGQQRAPVRSIARFM